jgi:hypothetical protein
VRADTFRWRGVGSETHGDGLALVDLRRFLADADDLALQLGTWAGLAVPVVLPNHDGTIRHIWVGVQHRPLPRLAIGRGR